MNKARFEEIAKKYNLSEEDKEDLRVELYGKENEELSKKDVVSEKDIIDMLTDKNIPIQLRGFYKYGDNSGYKRAKYVFEHPEKYGEEARRTWGVDYHVGMTLEEYTKEYNKKMIERYGIEQYSTDYMSCVRGIRTSIFRLADSALGNFDEERAKVKIPKEIADDYTSMCNELIKVYKKYQKKENKVTEKQFREVF